MKAITQNEIKQINELYLQLKTYAAVSRATGFSPATVKKYVKDGYGSVDESKIKRFEGNLPDMDLSKFMCDDWRDLCVLSDEEITEIRELWKEIEL